MKPDLVIFDLDGTLVDSRLDLAEAVNVTLSYLGRDPLAHDRIYSYVGNGIPLLVRRSLGADTLGPEFQKALAFFVSWYRDHALVHTCLYEGVGESLARLHSAGSRLAVLTNKATDIAYSILGGLGIADYFFRIYGGDSFSERKPHPLGVNVLLAETGIPHDHVVLVGDSAVDVQAARSAGVRVHCVNYGFAPETLTAHPPDMLFDNMAGIVAHLLESAEAV